MKYQQNSFNSGIYSDTISARVDYQPRFSACGVLENMICIPQGPAIGRPGTIFESKTRDSDQNASSTKMSEIIGLDAASGTSYLVEMSEYYMCAYGTDGVRKAGSNKSISAVGGSATFTASTSGGYILATHSISGDLPLPGSRITLTNSGGALPTGLATSTAYYISEDGYTGTTFRIASDPQGTPITYTDAGTGTHTLWWHTIEFSTAPGYKNDDIIKIDADNGATSLAGTWALKAGQPQRKAVTVDNTTDTITLAAHGFSDGDKVYFLATTMPGNITAATIYYVKDPTTNTFKIADSAGQAARGINSNGTNVYVVHATSAGFTRFQLAAVDGTLDYAPTDLLVSQSSNSNDHENSGYTSGSNATWYGKHHPYPESDLFDSANRFDLGYAVLGDSIFFTHENHWPRQLKVNSATDWDFTFHSDGVDYIDPDNEGNTGGTWLEVPYYNDGPYVSLNSRSQGEVIGPDSFPGKVLGTSVNIYSRKALVWSDSDVGKAFRSEGTSQPAEPWWVVVDSVTDWTDDSSTPDATGIVHKTAPQAALAWTTAWRMGLLFAGQYMRKCAFVQDRWAMAGMSLYPTRVEMSETSNYKSFSPTDITDSTEVLDSSGVSFSIAAQAAGRTNWIINSSFGALVGCEGGVYLVSGDDTGRITPGAVSQTLASGYGAENIPPLEIGSEIFYIETGGRAIRRIKSEAIGSEGQDASRLFFDALESPIVSWTFARDIVPIIWAAQADGTIVGITAETTDGIFGCHTHTIGGTGVVVESITTMRDSNKKDETWMVVKRTVNSNTVRYIEKLSKSIHLNPAQDKDDTYCVDSAYIYNPDVGGSVTNVPANSCDHLEGETVDVVADGIVSSNTISSGVLATPLSVAAADIHVGLAYVPAFETMDIEAPAAAGQSLGNIKRIHEVDISFYKTITAYVGPDSSNMEEIKCVGETAEIDWTTVTTAELELFTGVSKQKVQGGRSTKPRVRIEQRNPLPICILALNIEYDMKD